MIRRTTIVAGFRKTSRLCGGAQRIRGLSLIGGAQRTRGLSLMSSSDTYDVPPLCEAWDVALSSIETPALCIDLDALERNEVAAEKLLRESSDTVKARPHVKSHKCPYIATRQLARSKFTCGLSAATVSEIMAMALEAGANDLLLTNQVLSPAKLGQLADICAKFGPPGSPKDCSGVDPAFSLRVCVDSRAGLEALSAAAVSRQVIIGAVIEQNVGQDRCGVSKAQQVVELAKQADILEGVRFAGLQGYHGACQHERKVAARNSISKIVANKLRETILALENENLKCSIVTGGGTGTFLMDAEKDVLTEVQPGSYLFMDTDYGQNEEGFSKFEPSMFVVSSIISVGESPRRAILDAGLKSHSVESGLPTVPVKWKHLDLLNGGDEHMILVAQDVAHALPALNERISLLPGHVDPTFAMHDFVYFFRGQQVLFRAPIRR